jgi:hypothetical protein
MQEFCAGLPWLADAPICFVDCYILHSGLVQLLQQGHGTNEDLLMKLSREAWWRALVCSLQHVQVVTEV